LAELGFNHQILDETNPMSFTIALAVLKGTDYKIFQEFKEQP
jgi:hypothetical protein